MLIRSQNVLMNQLALDDVAYITEEIDANMNRSRVQPGDVLLNITGASIGRVTAFDLKNIRANVNQHVCVIRPKSNILFGRYLAHFLSSPEFQAEIDRIQHGGTRQALTFSQIADFQIPLLPLMEQQRIAQILDKAEALRAKRSAALPRLDTLTQSIFLELFGDPKLNQKKWPTHRIGSVISEMHGGASLKPEDFVDSGFPILHKGAIKPNGGVTLDLKKKTFATSEYAAANRKSQVDRRFLAVTLRDLIPTGPSIGLVADLRDGPCDKYLLAQGAYGFLLKPEMVVPEYLVYLSNMPNFRHVLRQNSVGSTQIHIRTPIYLEIQIPLPPIELQREFADQIATVQRIKTAQQESSLELDALFGSIQERAFSGALL
jgi:type I restriction enzyme S subunit